eukprot:2457591-Pleurochrysis_carterae.AAC.1
MLVRVAATHECHHRCTQLERLKPTLCVLSPGPGCPKDFKLSDTIEMMLKVSRARESTQRGIALPWQLQDSTARANAHAASPLSASRSR